MASSTLTQESTAGVRTWTPTAVWQRLTDPSVKLQEPERRRRARLLSSLLVIVIPLIIVAAFGSVVLIDPTGDPLASPILYTAVAAAAVLSIAYALSRSPNYAAGAVITVIAFSAAAFAVILTDPTRAGVKDMIAYLSTAMLLGSILLSVRETLLVAVIDILGIFALPLVVPDITPESVVPSLTFIIVTSVIILVAAAIRQRDLGQIEQQSRDLAVAVERARTANKLKDQFLATMSHELRTPLNAIIGFAEVMMMGLAGEINPQALHAIDRIHQNSERLLELIDDILDISKIEAGRIELVNQSLDLRELLSNIELTFKPQAIQKGLEFRTQLEPGMPAQLVGDGQRLEQIMTNLVSNAIKFTDRGHVTMTIRRAEGQKWQVEVSDSGIGIPAHALEFIFEKFRQVDGSSRRAYSGTGLGLAIVKELTVLMDGQIKAQSQPGTGSQFTVTLPLIDTERLRN